MFPVAKQQVEKGPTIPGRSWAGFPARLDLDQQATWEFRGPKSSWEEWMVVGEGCLYFSLVTFAMSPLSPSRRGSQVAWIMFFPKKLEKWSSLRKGSWEM